MTFITAAAATIGSAADAGEDVHRGGGGEDDCRGGGGSDSRNHC